MQLPAPGQGLDDQGRLVVPVEDDSVGSLLKAKRGEVVMLQPHCKQLTAMIITSHTRSHLVNGVEAVLDPLECGLDLLRYDTWMGEA